MSQTQINYPFYLGLCLSLVVVALAIVGPWLAPRDPMHSPRLIRLDGVTYGRPPISRSVPPFRSSDYLLGTDALNRDVLSRLLWAVRPTLLLCLTVALTRIVVGVTFGLIGGWFGGKISVAIDSLIGICMAIPLLAFAIAALLIIGLDQGLPAFVIALALTGWCNVAILVRTRVQLIRRAPYIESAITIGRSVPGLLWQHVLPQLRPILPMLLAFELTAVLLVVAELGYLGYYIGGGFIYTYSFGDFDTQYLLQADHPELGQMLSSFFRQLYRTPWVSISAGICIFIALTAFSLLGDGLRRQLDVTRPQTSRPLLARLRRLRSRPQSVS